MGVAYRLDVAESKCGNQIAPLPSIFEREAFKFKNYICSKIYIRQCWSQKKSTLWTQNQNQKKLHLKLGHIRGKTKIFQRTVSHSNTWITQVEVNNLVRNFQLPKTKGQLLGSQLQQWKLLEKNVKVSYYRKSQSNIAKYFSIDVDMLYCKDVCGLIDELQLQHVPELWRMFVDLSKVSLKAVLLRNGNKHPSNTSCSCSPHERNLRQNLRFADKICYENHQWNVCKVKWSRYRPGMAQRVGRDIALLFHDRGTRRGWVVSNTPGRTLPPGWTWYPLYCTRGWVGPRAGLDGRKISSPSGFDPGPSSP